MTLRLKNLHATEKGIRPPTPLETIRFLTGPALSFSLCVIHLVRGG